MRNSNNSSSIVNKLRAYIFSIVILQTIMFVMLLIIGGVIEESKTNAYQLFHEKSSSRKDQMQLKIKNNWTKFDPYVDNIVELLNSDELVGNKDIFFEEAVPELITMLRTTEVTGAYIILDSDDNNDYLPALYLRDYDPFMNSVNNEDIYMVYGPSNLANILKIPLDQQWRNTFAISEDMDFIRKPCEKASITNNANLLGYWSKPFKLDENDNPIITYSIPLIDNSKKVWGVIGVEISLDYLYKHLPATDLQPRDSLGYLVGYRDDNADPISPLIMGGALQRRMIDENQPLNFEAVDIDRNIYLIKDHHGSEDLYASVEQMALYENNTPFENEQWYLIGIMRGDYLFNYTDNIWNILWISFFIAVILGTISAGFISIRLSKPVVILANQVKDVSQLYTMKLEPTGIFELDELSNAIQLANKKIYESTSKLDKIVELLGLPIGAYEINYEENTVFTTHNFYYVIGRDIPPNLEEIDVKTFNLIMSEVCSSPITEEENVYQIVYDDKVKWVSLEENRQGNSTIGVVMDITDDIIEKKQLIKERDHDPLTMVLNRKGFQWAYESWFNNRNFQEHAALIMFDMDNLKTTNDTYGHKWGDLYILAFVDCLREIAPEENVLIGRRSGDEFLLLLHEFKTKDEIRTYMDSFYKRLESASVKLPDGNKLPITASAGLVWIKNNSFTYDEFLHYADEALYKAKEGNKGYYVENINL